MVRARQGGGVAARATRQPGRRQFAYRGSASDEHAAREERNLALVDRGWEDGASELRRVMAELINFPVYKYFSALLRSYMDGLLGAHLLMFRSVLVNPPIKCEDENLSKQQSRPPPR